MTIKQIVLSAILILTFAFAQAQEASHSGKLPWVNGQMPNIRTNENRLIKISAIGNNLTETRQEATKLLIQKLADERGVIVNIENITKDIYLKNDKGVSGGVSAKEKMTVKSGAFEVIFSKIDEYYEYENGSCKLWALFLVSENGTKLTKVPNCKLQIRQRSLAFGISPRLGAIVPETLRCRSYVFRWRSGFNLNCFILCG